MCDTDGQPTESPGFADPTEAEHQVPRSQVAEQTSRLLRLPAELRNRIYTYALYKDNIQLYPGFYADARPEDQPDLALLKTCRQIHSEATPVFYNVNTFEFEFLFDIPKFKNSLTERNCKEIRSIRLQAPSIHGLVDGSGGSVVLHPLPSLRALHFRGHLCGDAWDRLAVTRLRADGKSIKIFAD